jgi:hypothetical protein
MNVISFSLYGAEAKYCVGAIRNTKLAPKIYPGWTCRFYIDEFVPGETITSLLRGGAEIYPGPKDIPPMFWRFLVADSENVERFIVRDADSRLDMRERAAVDEWIGLATPFHIMRDHYAHAQAINGGLWGGVGAKLYDAKITALGSMHRLIREWMAENPTLKHDDYGLDMAFLIDKVWPIVKWRCTQHDHFSRGFYKDALPFPTKRVGQSFCGEVYDENDVPREHDRAQIPVEP